MCCNGDCKNCPLASCESDKDKDKDKDIYINYFTIPPCNPKSRLLYYEP